MTKWRKRVMYVIYMHKKILSLEQLLMREREMEFVPVTQDEKNIL